MQAGNQWLGNENELHIVKKEEKNARDISEWSDYNQESISFFLLDESRESLHWEHHYIFAHVEEENISV